LAELLKISSRNCDLKIARLRSLIQKVGGMGYQPVFGTNLPAEKRGEMVARRNGQWPVPPRIGFPNSRSSWPVQLYDPMNFATASGTERAWSFR